MDSLINVSVIIPVYNQEACLLRCLESVLVQKNISLEVICVNDGSTDGSAKILEEMQRSDDRIVVISQENQGAGRARNAGLDAAGGEFVIFCDSDDRIPSNDAYAKLYHAAKDHDALVSAGGFVLIEENQTRDKFDDDEFLWGYSFSRDGFVDFADYQFDYGFTRFMFNREFLTSHGLKFAGYSRYEDPVFLVKALNEAKRFYAITDVVYECFGHDSFEWSTDQVLDLYRGIKDNLNYSSHERLTDLHALTLRRIEEEYAGVVSYPIVDEEVLDALLALNSSVDWTLIEEEKDSSSHADCARTIKPLRMALNDLLWRARISESASFKVARYVSAVPRILDRKMRSFRDKET